MAGFFDNLFGGGAEREAADKNRAAYTQYGTDGQGYLSQGYSAAQNNLNSALGSYTPLADLGKQYRSGTDMYSNALGLNGASGNAAAGAAFQNNPGYTGAVTAGLDAINRRRASAGMLNSGNADQDAQTFGQNLQNQQYNGWLSNLSGLNNNALQATSGVASGQAGAYGSMANLATGYGQDQTSLAGNVTSGMTNANILQAQGESAGARNLLGAGLSLASLGTQAFGGSLAPGQVGGSINGSTSSIGYGGRNMPRFGI